jgi:hypothetical protein
LANIRSQFAAAHLYASKKGIVCALIHIPLSLSFVDDLAYNIVDDIGILIGIKVDEFDVTSDCCVVPFDD